MRSLALAAAALAALLAFATTASQAAPGDLDPAFGHNWDEAQSVAIQPDGKIVVAGGSGPDVVSETFALARYQTNGRLDPTFGTGGKVKTPLGSSNSEAFDAAIQPDGKVVAVGASSKQSNDSLAVVRYDPDGSRDSSFGADGRVTTRFGSRGAAAISLAIQPDGKILAAGAVEGPEGADYDFALARYNPDGSLDSSFGSGGLVTTLFGNDWSFAADIALQADGRIVLAGSRFQYLEGVVVRHGFALARYKPDGSPDPTFGADGTVTTRVGLGGTASALALQPDGKIVAAGSTLGRTSEGSGEPSKFALIRYDENGALDPSFGSGGTVKTKVGPNSFAADLAILPDGKIVVAGTTTIALHYAFALVRYRPSGGLDTSFGAGGVAKTVFYSQDDHASALAIQQEGKIVVVGTTFDSVKDNWDFALARYLDTQPLCVVPAVKGKPLPVAKRSIVRAHCSIGRVKRTVSSTVKRGRVISQSPWPRAHRIVNAKVKLVVSRGKRTER